MAPRKQPRPTYLLKNIPPDLREAISEAAAKENITLQSVIRRTLSEHYGLEPGRETRHTYRPQADTGSTRLVVRLEQELFNRIKQDATMRQVIISILE